MSDNLKQLLAEQDYRDSTGGKTILDTGLYDATLNNVYVTTGTGNSKSEGIHWVFTLDNGASFEAAHYYKSREGSFTYIDKATKKPKLNLSAIRASEILALFGLPTLDVLPLHDGFANRYGKKTSVRYLTDFEPVQCKLAIIKIEKNHYSDKTKRLSDNELKKVLTIDGFTTKEIIEEAEAPIFIEEFAQKFPSTYIEDKFTAPASKGAAAAQAATDPKSAQGSYFSKD